MPSLVWLRLGLLIASATYFYHVSKALPLSDDPRALEASEPSLGTVPSLDDPEWHCFDSSKSVGPISDASDCYRAVLKIRQDKWYRTKVTYGRHGGPNVRQVPITFKDDEHRSCIAVLDRYNSWQTEDTFDLTNTWQRASSLIRDCVVLPKYQFGGIYDVGNDQGFFVVVMRNPRLISQDFVTANASGVTGSISPAIVPSLQERRTSSFTSKNSQDGKSSNLRETAGQILATIDSRTPRAIKSSPMLSAFTADCLRPGPRLVTTVASECRIAADQILHQAKSLSPVQWSKDPAAGHQVPEKWEHGSCKIVLDSFLDEVDEFSPADVGRSALRIVSKCLKGSERGPGGSIRIGHGRTFFVAVVGREIPGNKMAKVAIESDLELNRTLIVDAMDTS